MEVTAQAKYTRLSPDKARPLARRLQGLPVADALALTQFSKMKAAFYLGKTLKSALANAQNNADLSVDTLRVKEAIINEGPRLRRFWPRARGSAGPVRKRLCHVRIVLTDGQPVSVEPAQA
ncbi:MAG: 50S ribosomal protein L22 [Lentisphaerae bacterium]|nr:50S ribosomal protein L22 [Lentisphaerota bacterium]